MFLRAGTCEYEEQEAKEVLAGYCFYTQPGHWRPPSEVYGDLPEQPHDARWAYRAFDCCPRDPEGAVTQLDLVAPVLLNVSQGYGTGLMSRLLSVTGELSSTLQKVDVKRNFWDLPEDHISPAGIPPEGKDSWWLHRAWYLLESVDGAGRAITNKILHFKRPNQFPLADSRTLPGVPDGIWLHPHRDLNRFRDAYEGLERWFEVLASKHSGVPLKRLRIHDILLWTKLNEADYTLARASGEQILNSG